jgi:glutamate racemase
LKDELQCLLPQASLVDSGAAIARRVASLLPTTEKGMPPQNGIAFCARADADSYKKARILTEYGFAELKSLQ